jgi:hypothetical protein
MVTALMAAAVVLPAASSRGALCLLVEAAGNGYRSVTRRLVPL